MNCKKPYKTTEANAKSFLRTKGAIDKFLNIKDLNLFRTLHSELKEQAKKYIPDFSDKLFFEQNNGTKALPNSNAFKTIDNAKGIFYDKTESEGFYQLNKNNLNPLLESSIEKSENPDLISVFLTPSSYKEKLQSYGYTNQEINYLIEPLNKNQKLWLEAPNIHNLISFRIREQLKFKETNTDKKANKELDNLLNNYLKGLNITVSEYEDLKFKLGIDALGFANIIEKSIYLAKNREIDTLPEEAAHFYVELLTKRSTKDNLQEYNLYKDLISKIESWEKYTEIKEKYLPIYKDENKVKKEAIAKAISEAIVNRFESRDNQLKQAIINFLDWLKSVFKTNRNFSVELLSDEIAKKILSQDYSDIAKDLDESAKLTSFKDIDNEIIELINIFSKFGAILTGSMSLRAQGTIYRTSEETFHDIDFKVPILIKDEYLKKVKERFPQINQRLEFENSESYNTIWELDYKGKQYSIDFFFSKKEFSITNSNLVNWRDTFAAKLQMGRAKDVTDFINFIPLEQQNKTEVEKILTEGDVQVKELVQNKEKEVKLDKAKKPEVIKKMKEILDILGIKTEIAELSEEIAAQADILNRLIQFADDSITEDNFTEETIHFIVEILEQKNKPLFDKLMSEIWKYNIYTTVREEYSSFKQYQNENGRPDYYKLKKEAIGQLLVAKLLDTQEIKDDKNFIGAIWDAISRFIKSLFYNIPFNQRDQFQTLADEILQNPSLIESSDVQYLGQSSTFFSKKPTNKLISSLYKAKKAFGTASTSKFTTFNNNTEAWEYFKDLDSKIQKVTEKELNPQTNKLEDVEYYVFEGNKKQRVTSIIKEANNKTFSNISQDEQAKALREAKKQKGTEVHKTIEDILNRYIDADTGELKVTPENRPLNLSVPKANYDKLENHIQNRLATYPKGTKFLMETKVVNEEQGYAGTIDFIAILPNNQVDILDWKTTDVSYWEAGVKRKRFDISPFNQTYWKTQLSFYKRALESHGIEEFRYTRAIPIALETKQSLIDKSKKYTPDNVIYEITKIEVGDSDPKKIVKEQFYLTPVSTSDESTGIEGLDKLIEKLQGIYDRIQKTTYSKEEAYKKKQELDRLNLAIREIQTKKTATLFTNLFTENFERFNKLTEKQFDFLKEIKPNQKFLSGEQEQELHAYLNDVYSAIEFLQAFEDFPGVIGELYKEGELTDYEKEVKKAAVEIGGKSQTIANQLVKDATEVIDQLGQLYNIDQTSQLDRKNIESFGDFVSILHKEEGSIQFASRLINAIKFLGNQEANKLFDEDSGKFTVIYKSALQWAKDNNKTIEQFYSYLLNKDKNGNPVRELLSKIKSEFFTELEAKQKSFSEFYKIQQDTLSDIGYKGERFNQELHKAYKKHVENWLSDNFNIEEYEKAYKEALKKYKESNKNVRLDEDNLINEEKKRKRLQSWIEEHDIFSSPKALTSKNYLLYNTLNESKWYSEDYKNLLKPENKPLLDAYNLFIDLNKRAEDSGMLDDVFNAKRWVPNVAEESVGNAIKKSIKSIGIKESAGIAAGAIVTGLTSPIGIPTLSLILGGATAWYAIKKAYPFISKYFDFVTNVNSIEPQLDPLTGKQLRRIPVKYKYAEEGQDLSNDLFSIYSKWADHIIRYEMLSNYENRFKMVQLLESLKQRSFAVDNKGNIVRKRDKATNLATLQQETTIKSAKIEDDLEKIINNYVYSTNLDVKPAWYKIGNLLYDYTALNFLGINTTAWVANIIGGSISARLNEGKWFDKNDYLTVGVNTTLGVFNKELPKYGNNLYQKSRFLIKTLDTRIQSEYDRDPSDKFSKSKFKAGDIAFSGFRLGDHFIQDSIASAMFLNTTIIDGKFVNINDLVKAKYDKKIYNAVSNQERKKLIKERNQEIETLKKTSNLYRFIEGDKKLSIKGIDLNTQEGQTELLSYQNKVAHYIKAAIGNIDEFDKSINKMTWNMKFVMQFKNWMPRVFGSRLQDIEYLYELDDYHYGRAKIFIDSFRLNMKATVGETLKSLHLIIPFVDKTITNQSIIDLAKSQYLAKKSDAIAKNRPFDLTEEQFVDIYLTGFKNQLTEFSHIVQFGLAVTFIALAYSGSDDKDKWYWKILSRVLFKVDRELNFAYDPNQLLSFATKGFIPVLGALTELYNVLDAWKDESIGIIEEQLGFEEGEEKREKAKPLSKTVKATPLLRELHYYLTAISEEYADYMEVEQPKTDLDN